MVKILENNGKLIITVILYVIYWCEVNAANSTADTVIYRQANQRRGHRRRGTTTEDKSYHPRKRHHSIALQVNTGKSPPSRTSHQTEKQRETPHVDHTEKWSIEAAASRENDDSLDNNFKIYYKQTTPKHLQDEKAHDIQKIPNHNRKQNEYISNDAAMNWLFDTMHEDVKDSLEKPRSIKNRRKSRRHKETARTATDVAFTKSQRTGNKPSASARDSNNNRKRKLVDEPTAMPEADSENDKVESEKSKKYVLQNKTNNDRDLKVLRAGGFYQTENNYGAPRHNFNPARLQFEKVYGNQPGHLGLVISSEEQEARHMSTKKVGRHSNKLKYMWSSEQDTEPTTSKHKYREPEKKYDTHHNTENKKKYSAPKHYYPEKEKISKHKYTDDENKYNEAKQEHYEDKKKKNKHHQEDNEQKPKHGDAKYHYIKHERQKEVHKNYNFEDERAPKHNSDRIHREEVYDNRPDYHDIISQHKKEAAVEPVKVWPKLKKNRNALRHKNEKSTTHHDVIPPYEKVKDIRTGVLSLEEPSSETEDVETTTKKIKLRLRDYKKDDNVNILRSTRMPSAYELQEENPEDQQPEDVSEKIKTPNIRNEDLNPYAMEMQMRRFANCYVKERIANVTVEVIGRTVEYNNIILLKMSEMSKDTYFRAKDDTNKYTDEKPEKKIIFIVHGLTVAGMRHILYDVKTFNTLMKMYVSFVDKFDIYVMPMANPDGYAATFNARAGTYWNKNLSPQSGCPGVVLDRNFDVGWNSSVKLSSCSHLYPGPVPFSEAETRAVRDVFHLYSHRLVAYIHVHASTYYSTVFKGDAILYPRGYTDVQTDDDKYIDLKGEVEEAMKNASFQVISVTVDTLHNWYGKVSGSSVDYAASVYGIPYAMEFSMQMYEEIQQHALSQIWGRLIPLVFKSIWKNMNSNPGDL